MLKRNLIANYFGQGWTTLINLALIPIYIKYLGIEAYGLIGLFGILQAGISLLDMGLTPTLGREMSRYCGGGQENQRIRNLFYTVEILASLIGLLIVAVAIISSNWIATSWLITDTLPADVVAQAFAIMGVVAALRFIEGIYRSVLMGLQRQVSLNIADGAMATLRGFGAIGVLAWISSSITTFFIWQGFISIMTLVVLRALSYSAIPKSETAAQFSITLLRSVWQFAVGMIGITFLTLLLTQVDKILLSKLLTLQDFGYYTLAATLAGSLYILVKPITQAYYPKFCELHAQDKIFDLVNAYHKGAQLVSVTVGSLAVVLIFFGNTFLQLWTRNIELSDNVADLMSLLVVGNLLNCLMHIPYQIQLTYGWTKLSIYVNVIAVLILIPAILVFVPKYGAIAAGWIWVFLNMGYAAISVQFMYFRLMKNEKKLWYVDDTLLPIFVAVCIALILKIVLPNPESLLAQFSTLSSVILSTLIASCLSAGAVRKLLLKMVKKIFPQVRN